jgi:hypothetical protein
MVWDETIKATDVAIVIATLCGPILAVQAQVWLERRRGKQGRRQQIFYTLMRTRAAALSPDHVHAINAIPVEFHGVETIISAYKEYIDHLNVPQTNVAAWNERRVDLFMDLLHKISQRLGYDFTVAQLKGEYYAPKWQFDLEAEQTAIRQALAKILSGEAALPMDVKTFPGDSEAQAALKAVLKGERAIKVSPEPLGSHSAHRQAHLHVISADAQPQKAWSGTPSNSSTWV